MRTLTMREQWFTLLLLPFLAIAMYLAWVRPQFERRLEASERKAATAKPSSRPAAKGTTALQHELDEALREKARLEQRRAAWLASWTRPESRTAAVESISRVFQDAGCSLRGASRAGVNSKNAQIAADPLVPLPLRDLDRVARELGGAAPELWRIELSGSFNSALDAIDRTRVATDFVLPISIAMAPSLDADDLTFSLWIWI